MRLVSDGAFDGTSIHRIFSNVHCRCGHPNSDIPPPDVSSLPIDTTSCPVYLDTPLPENPTMFTLSLVPPKSPFAMVELGFSFLNTLFHESVDDKSKPHVKIQITRTGPSPSPLLPIPFPLLLSNSLPNDYDDFKNVYGRSLFPRWPSDLDARDFGDFPSPPLCFVQVAMWLKQAATEAFGRQHFFDANEMYGKCDNYLSFVLDRFPNEKIDDVDIEKERVKVSLNIALVQLRLKQYSIVINEVDRLLETDGLEAIQLEKAWYRRGLACLGLEDSIGAEWSFLKVIEVNEKNMEARKQVKEILQVRKQKQNQEHEKYKNILEVINS